jgi:hypothetical protein
VTWVLVLAGLVGAFSVGRGLVTGAATSDGRIRREEQPLLYWTLLAIAAAITFAFFYFAFFPL